MDAKDVELECTKEALRNVERKMEEMRQEMEKLKEERSQAGVYALGFEPSTFMASNPVAALAWVTDSLSVEMKKEILKYPNYFERKRVLGGARDMGFKPCLSFNRGEGCVNKWHVSTRPKKNGDKGYRKELRLHCCALCFEALDSVAGHPLMTCPWLSIEEWKKIEIDEKKLVEN